MVLRTLRLGERRTTIRLEESISRALDQVATLHGTTVAAYCAEIEREHGHGNLTSAVRATVVADMLRFLPQAGSRKRPSPRELERSVRLASFLARSENHRLRSIVVEREGDCEQRWDLGLDGITATGSRMRSVFERWDGLRRQASMVPGPETMPDLLRDARGLASLIDVRADAPKEYLVSQTSAASHEFFSYSVAPAALGAFPNPLIAERLQEAMAEVRANGEPRLQVLRHWFAGRERAFARLLLPIVGSDGRTVQVVSVVEPFAGPYVEVEQTESEVAA